MPPTTTTRRAPRQSNSATRVKTKSKVAKARTKSTNPKPKMTKKRNSTRTRRRPINADDLASLIGVATPVLSHDGESVCFVRKHLGERNRMVSRLWMVPARGGEPHQFTAGENDSAPAWSHDDNRIAFIRQRRDEGKAQLFVIPRDGGEARAITDMPEGTISSFKWSPDNRHIAFTFRETDPDWTKQATSRRKETGESDPPRVLDDIWYRLDGDGYFNAQRFAIYLLDAETGETKKLFAKDSTGTYSYDFAPDGKRLAVTANPTREALLKPWNDNVYLVDVPSGRSKMIKGLPRGPKTSILFSPDGKTLAWAGREGAEGLYSPENLGLFIHDLDAEGARDILAKTDYCLMAITLSDTAEVSFGPNFRWHPDGDRLLMQIGWHGTSHLGSVPASGGRVTFLTGGSMHLTLGNVDSTGTQMAALHGDPVTPPEVAVLKLRARSAHVKLITDFNRTLLDQLDLASPESHWITSDDGTDVHVWIMRPPASAPKQRKRAPAVLQIHGGPHAQYGELFFHEFQTLAAAGYTVFYANPRGSKGYGEAHCAAIRGAWGTADWTDVRAVIDFMKDHPNVDPKRMAVMGGSYGGYMTNWVIGKTNDFKAAVTDRCVSNLVSMWGNSDFPAVEDRYWPGNVWDRPEALWASSPVRHLGNATTPTLIIHSEGDLRCNIEQSEQVFTILKSKGVETRFVRYPASTSHGLSRSGPIDLRLHRLQQIHAWIDNHLGA